MQKALSDTEILEQLLTGEQAEDIALRQVYLHNRPMIVDYIRRNNGSPEEAKDVFQETVIAFYENVKARKFKGESAISSYLYSIARFNWMNRLKRKGIGERAKASQQVEEETPGFLPVFLEKEQESQVLQVFHQLGQDCQKVLGLSIYHYFNNKEIAHEMNYENEQVARNKRYKCMKRLKEMIKEKPKILAFLTES